MTFPLALHSASVPSAVRAPSRIVELVPRASAIWLATVRCQISSYSRSSSPETSRASSPGVRNTSPDGRMASCASCAFFTLLA